MSNLSELERRALHEALEGREEWRSRLLRQIPFLDVKSRDDSGCGIFTNFTLKLGATLVDIPETIYRDPPSVRASHSDIPGGAVFLVWLKAGAISCLEMALGLGQTPVAGEGKFVFEKRMSSAGN